MTEEKIGKTIINEDFKTQFMTALESKTTTEMLKIMHLKGSLKQNLPDIDRLFDVPERIDLHPEGNSGNHTLLTIKEVKDASPMMKYAMLVHDLGKVITFEEQIQKAEEKGEPYEVKDLTKHFNRAEKGVPLVEEVSDTLGVPSEWKEFAKLVCNQHMKAHDFDKMKDSKLFEFNQAIPDQYFESIISCCLADALGRNVSDKEKQEIKDGFKVKLAKVKEVRSYMATHPEEGKEEFANNFAKYKKQQHNMVARDGMSKNCQNK